jgi:ribosomal protein S18 acetylase RimI-like enzyme
MEISSTDDLQRAVDRLEREPLRNIVLLKHIEAFPGHVSVEQICAGQNVGTLVLLDTRVNAFDRETYPEAELAALLSSDDPALTRRLLGAVPAGRNIVFKLATDADRDMVAARFPIRRAMGFLSFTADGRSAFAADDEVSLSTTASEAAFRMFEAQGHAKDGLCALLSSERAFVCALEQDGEPRSLCFAFENHRKVWEVGGVVTSNEHRRRGLAARVVRTALNELQRRALIPRYQVSEDNLPSIRLATSIGLREFLRISHFRNW